MGNRDEHVKLAPSASHRWIECPGSIALTEGIEEEDSVYAREGSFAHAVAAHCLAKCVDLDSMIGKTIADVSEDEDELSKLTEFEVDPEMVVHLQTYLDAVEHALMETPGADLMVERKVFLVGLRDDIGGTADAIVHTPKTNTLDIFDLKYGQGVLVDVVNNSQLRTYGLASLLSFPKFRDVTHVNMHIVQPRHHLGGHTIEEMTVEELVAWGNEVIKPGAERTEMENAPLHAGDWCRFCDAKPQCPELRDMSLERTQELFQDMETLLPAKTPPKPELLSNKEIGVALKAFPIIEQWMKAVREHAYKLANSGKEIPGQKLVQKTGYRKWDNELEAQDALEMLLPEGESPFAPSKLVTPAQAEKLLPKARRGIVKVLAHTPKTGTVLVSDSDKRLPYRAGSVFAQEKATTPTEKKD